MLSPFHVAVAASLLLPRGASKPWLDSFGTKEEPLDASAGEEATDRPTPLERSNSEPSDERR
jgi:hypothetical protein